MMKPSTKDRVDGKFHEIKGAVKEKAGELTNNPRLEGAGMGEKIAGKIQGVAGKIEKALEPEPTNPRK
jgi:uncharacterized protein YjbJ (UPF0337 family)